MRGGCLSRDVLMGAVFFCIVLLLGKEGVSLYGLVGLRDFWLHSDGDDGYDTYDTIE